MSASDIVLLFKALGILDHIISVASHDFGFWDEEELADTLTYMPQEDILVRLLGKNDRYTKMYNKTINEKVRK